MGHTRVFNNLTMNFFLLALLFPSLIFGGNAFAAGSEIVIEGRLNHETIEGGFWTFRTNDGKLYDIHGDVQFQDGDRLKAKGITPQGISCVHMKGTIFIPTFIEKIESVHTDPPSSRIASSSTTWKLMKDTFICYGAGGEILWQEGKVQSFKSSLDGRVVILIKHFDPKGGKKRRDYAAVYQDGKPVFEFYEVPLAVTFRKDEAPYYLTPNGRFGWIQDKMQTIFFDTWTKQRRNFKGDGFSKISNTGNYKIWGMKFGENFTMLRQEGQFE